MIGCCEGGGGARALPPGGGGWAAAGGAIAAAAAGRGPSPGKVWGTIFPPPAQAPVQAQAPSSTLEIF